MIPKDTGFFTRHVEKFILGVGLLVLVIICLIFVLGSPYEATVRSGVQDQSKGPAEIEAMVRDKARELDTKLKGEVPFKQPQIPNYVEAFHQSIDQPFHSQTQFIAWNDAQSPEFSTEFPEGREFKLPNPSMPVSVTARAGHAVLNFSQLQDSKTVSGFRDLVGSETPADFRYVSVEAIFDKQAWAQRFRDIPDENQVPEHVFSSNLFVTSVYLLRQAKDPVTGQWGSTQVIQPLPGQIAFSPSQPKGLTPSDTPTEYSLDEGSADKRTVRTKERQIAKPAFPPLLGINPWLAPDSASEQLTQEQRNDLFLISEKIREQQENIDRLKQRNQDSGQDQFTPGQRLEQARREDRRDQPGEEGEDYIGGRGPGVNGPGRDERRRQRRQRLDRQRQAAAARRQGNQNPNQARLDRMYKRLDELKQQRQDMLPEGYRPPQGQGMGQTFPGTPLPGQAQENPYEQTPRDQGRGRREGYNDYGPGRSPQGRRGQGRGRGRSANRPNGYRGRGQGQPGEFRGEPGVPRISEQLPGDQPPNGSPDQTGQQLPPGQMKVWAHDLTVEPNRTYRYKIVVTMLNPLFQRQQLSEEQVKQNKNRIALAPTADRIKSADWSKPVQVEPKYYFYVVGGSPSENRAQIEIYRLFGGRWRMEEFDAQPGDSIGGVVEIDGPTGVQKVDMRVGAYMVDMVSVAGAGPGGQVTRMLYFDPLTDRIQSRSLSADRGNTQRQRLRSITQRRAEATN